MHVKCIAALVLAAAALPAAAAGEHAWGKRQDQSSSSAVLAASSGFVSTQVSTDGSFLPSTLSPTAPSTGSYTSIGSIVATSTGTVGSGIPSSFTTSILPLSTTLSSSNASSNATSDDSEALPLRPEITPALAVGGVILMLTGVVYTLIGIKNLWIQVFLSAAYLTSLSITVLLVYVMVPPISKAVEGGYLVATVVPAAILGGGSLIFRDITQGIGCFLGGFCFSMWLLVLKPGGLIDSTAGKVIFIGAFCITVFCLSISRYTKSYAIIGSTSFSGATAVVLGIDCFSRAGLKEFWVYIWALNGNIFPLLTSTYPVTRGMRVEIAAIVIFTIFGIMSQMKIWKLIEEKRKTRALEEKRKSQQREQMEEALGRDIEAGNERERTQWEAAYGDGDAVAPQHHKDSGVGTDEDSGSTRKLSMNVTESRESAGSIRNSVKLSDLNHLSRKQLNGSKAGSVVSVYSNQLDNRSDVDARSISRASVSQASVKSSVPSGSTPRSTRDFGASGSSEHLVRNGAGHYPVSGALEKTPLISEELPSPQEDASPAASIESLERTHGRPLLERMESNESTTSLEAQGAVSIRDVDTRSILLNGDEEGHGRVGTAQKSLRPKTRLKHGDWIDVLQGKSEHSSSEVSANSVRQAEGMRGDGGAFGADLMNELQRVGSFDTIGDKDATKELQYKSSAGNLSKPVISISEHEVSPSESQADDIVVDGLSGQLPEANPKVAVVYRTNEWAKHLDGAEKPEADILKLPGAQTVEEPDEIDEPVARVDIEALQQTSLPSVMTQSSRDLLAKQSRSPMSPPQSISEQFRPIHRTSRNSSSESQPQLQRYLRTSSKLSTRPDNTRSSSSALKTKALRSSSNPITTLPEDVATTTFLTSKPRSTLLAQRNTKISDKNLSLRSAQTFPTSPGQSTTHLVHSAVNKDITTLPSQQRSSLLRSDQLSTTHAHAQFLAAQSRSTSNPSARRASMLAAWRESLQQDTSIPQPSSPLAQPAPSGPQRPYYEAEIRRMENLRDKETEKGMVAKARERPMSAQAMNEAHREVLRRMQAGVNKSLQGA